MSIADRCRACDASIFWTHGTDDPLEGPVDVDERFVEGRRDRKLPGLFVYVRGADAIRPAVVADARLAAVGQQKLFRKHECDGARL